MAETDAALYGKTTWQNYMAEREAAQAFCKTPMMAVANGKAGSQSCQPDTVELAHHADATSHTNAAYQAEQ